MRLGLSKGNLAYKAQQTKVTFAGPQIELGDPSTGHQGLITESSVGVVWGLYARLFTIGLTCLAAPKISMLEMLRLGQAKLGPAPATALSCT